MRLAWLVLSVLLLVVLASCRREAATSTPPAVAVIERPNLPSAVSLLTLARNPSAFEGESLILSGDYRPLPLPICVDEAHPSPATWALFDDSAEILVSGFDSALRELASPGLRLEVEGRWREWEGPVGCGRRAPVQSFWYLQLNNILSPNPLTAALPDGSAPAAFDTPIAPPAPIAEGDGTLAALTATVSGTGDPSGLIPTATPTLTGALSPVASITVGPTTSVAVRASVTPFPTFSPTPTPLTTPNGTATSNGNTPAPTATSTGTLSPTPTIDSGGAVLVNYDDLNKRTIAGGVIHEWQFAGATDLPVIISVAPSRGLDLALELIDPNGGIVGTYDQGGLGQVEVINEAALPTSGLYTIEVSTIDRTEGAYGLVLQSDSSRPTVSFQGFISYGETRTDTTPVNGDHLWNFEGVAGDVINIRVTATTSTDMQIYLNGHDGRDTEFVNDNTTYSPPSDREEILNLRLPATGLYTLGIGEENLDPLGYTILIERA